MAKRTVKFRLVTFFDQVANQVTPGGEDVLVERVASMGDEIELRKVDEERLDSLGALYTKDEAKAIKDGTYNGPDAPVLAAFTGGAIPAAGTVQPADGEHGDAASMDAPALAEYIREHRLNIKDTVALAGDDPESVQKVLDAENIATDNAPRQGVLDALEPRLAED